MTAGELRERVEFQTQAAGDSTYGATVDVWSVQFTVWAGYKWLQGGEPVLAQRLQGVQPVVIKIRTSEQARQVTPGWRARDTRTGAIFNIRSAKPTADRAYIEIMADTGVAT